MSVVAEAASGYQAIQLATIHRPALALVDVQLPGITGLNVVRALKGEHPRIRAIVLSADTADELLLAAALAGAAAFVGKDATLEALVDTVQRVMRGERPIDLDILRRPALAQRLLSELRHEASADAAPNATPVPNLLPLSPREAVVLDCMVLGLSNKEIAAALYITEQTVKNHMTAVYKKLGVRGRLEALRCAIRHGWVQIGGSRPKPARA